MFFESLLINISVLVVLIVALVFDYVTKFFTYWYIRHVQYKHPVPFFGSDYHRILNLRNTTDEVGFLYKKYENEKFVGCYKSRIPDLIVKDPDTVKKVLSTDFSNFHYRGCGLDKSRDICLRNNLFYAEGEKWTLLRKKFELLFNQMDDDIQNSLHDCLSGTNGVLEVKQLLSDILDVVFKDLLLDSKVDECIIKNIRKVFQNKSLKNNLKSYLKDILPSLYVLFGFQHISGEEISELKTVINTSKLFQKIKKVEELSDNESKQDKNCDLSRGDNLYSTFMLFINEGYIPCHNLLTAILFELARNPNLQPEVRACDMRSKDNDTLDRVIKEALRRHPPYSVISRQCTKSCQCSDKGFLVDKGITFTIPLKNLHNDEKYYSKCNEFDPDRFSDGDASAQPPVFLPFGLGPRKCVGEQLAMRIVRDVTYAILIRYQLSTTDKTPTTLQTVDFNFKRVIDGDVWLRFQPL